MIDEVARRIEACLHYKRYFLSLAELDLEVLPAEVCELAHLTELDLQNNRLTELPESFGNLTGLTRLDLRNNRLTELPESFGNLTGLREADLQANLLTTLPETIGDLNLQTLNLRGNELESLPEAIGRITQLHMLDLCGNQLRTLPESLGDIPALHRFDIDSFDRLAPEVAAAGARGQTALLTFLRELAASAVTIREAKLIIIGEGGVGKSSLLAAMLGESFDENRTTTHGVEVKKLKLESKVAEDITFNAWDFGGQKAYRPTHQFFFTAPAVYIVAWNPRLGSTAGCVDEWIDLVRRRVGDNVRIHVVATHSGPQGQLGDLEPKRLKRFHGDCIAGFHYIDSQTGMGIAALKEALAETAASLHHIERRIPARWQSFLNALNQSGESYLDYTRYLAEADRFDLNERSADSLARVAAELGHWCYYPDVTGLEDLIVLKGDWLSKAISFVLNDPATRSRNGLISHDYLGSLWNDPKRPEPDRYPARLHNALRLLMREYQLAYQVHALDDSPTSLISQLVPAVMPDLAEWETYGQALPQQTYIIEFVDGNHRTVIPEGLMYQIITWFHRFSLGNSDYERSIHWSNGIVLDDDHNGRALIEVDGDRLKITVKAGYPTYLCKLISHDIRRLVSNWKGLTAQILVPCADQCARLGELWSGTAQFNVSLLQQMKSNNVREDYCRMCFRPVQIDALIGEMGTLTEVSKAPGTVLLADLVGRIDRLESRIYKEGLQARADVMAAVDNVIDRVRTELDEQTQQYMKLISDEAAEGPRLFTIEQQDAESWKGRFVRRSVKVVLWCEHSRLPVHVLERDQTRGVYKVGVTPEWVTVARPWIGIAAQVLRLGSDFVPAVLKLNLDEAQVKVMENHLKIAELTAKEIASVADGFSKEPDSLSNSVTGMRESTPQAGLRALHALLREKDPTFGGLQRVRDRDRYLWVHPRYIYEYDQ